MFYSFFAEKLSQTEERAKVLDEKFQKLKSAYTQLREEHITLIRQVSYFEICWDIQ